jgi:hypothetical protein
VQPGAQQAHRRRFDHPDRQRRGGDREQAHREQVRRVDGDDQRVQREFQREDRREFGQGQPQSRRMWHASAHVTGGTGRDVCAECYGAGCPSGLVHAATVPAIGDRAVPAL